jgi:hypothetical protein
MRALREHDQLILRFNFLEAQLLRRALDSLAANYRVRPEDCDPASAAAWYGAHACQSARWSAEQRREWLEALHGFKSLLRQRVEAWSRQLGADVTTRAELRCPAEEAPSLLNALNDHRLWLAARHHIGQAEMDVHTPEDLIRLNPACQQALIEVHFLAGVMEEILALLGCGHRPPVS